MQQNYRKRLSDNELQSALNASGAVLIEGPKWCGKTSTAQHAARSSIYLQNPDKRAAFLAMADAQPTLLLQGDAPRLIDEWQMAPVLWDAVRYEVDRRRTVGQFILTGSTTPDESTIAHTGTGRIARLRMRPMSLLESGESTGHVSLRALFDGNQNLNGGQTTLSLTDIAHALCRGGWPATLNLPPHAALKTAQQYVESIIHYDVSAVDDIQKDPERVRVLLRSLARNTATTANFKTILDDLEASPKGLSDRTVSTYMHALERIFVVEDLPAWQPSLRSKTAIRTSPKRHFVDPSIATAALRVSPEALLQDFELFGLLFESLCTRDLRIFAQSLDGDVFHYRDKTGLEADLILRLRDGRWGAIEVKLGQRAADEAAKNLLKLSDRIDQMKTPAPSFLMILTASEYAFQRPDGVWNVPLACLGN